MGVLLRVFAVLAVLIAAFLVYAVINAAASDGGARVGVAIAYIVGALLLTWAAVMSWRRAGRGQATPSQV
jgi:predicted Co/Zn/Cd cation transporter (cation efflux family)